MQRGARPLFAPSYGISDGPEGLLDWAWAEERLVNARNYWLATCGPDGSPHAAPVWGVWLDGRFVFGTDDASRKARNLAVNPRAVLHLESGDEVVIVEGTIGPLADPAARLVASSRYLDKYEVDTGDGSGLVALTPTRAFAWIEADYPNTATAFRLA